MPILYLIRHGETDWNRTGRIMGAQPVPLNQNGVRQVEQLAKMVATLPVRALYSSPVVRARQTAELLSPALGVPVIVEPGITEIGVGQWEGRYWSELIHEHARTNFYRLPQEARPPGGETLGEVQQRAVSAVQRICSGTEDGLLVLISHADVVRTILAHYLGTDLQAVHHMQISHASLTALAVTKVSADLLCLNYRPDLAALR